MDKYLHVVAPEFPVPSDAGLLKELVYMIRAFHSKGINIYLHCFGEGNGQALAPYCKEIHFYSKKMGHEGYSLQIPHAVASRSSEKMTSRLMMDDHPVLFAGFQTVFPLLDQSFNLKRNVVVRVLRNEEEYFNDLVNMHAWGAQKLFCMAEAHRFRHMMKTLSTAGIQLASTIEIESFNFIQSPEKVSFVAPFMAMPFLMQPEGSGNYCFFHGNLGEAENEYAALWLLNNVFDSLELPFVIAGNNPSAKLEKAAHLRMHTCLVANPGEKELQDLIKKAQVNLLPSFVTDAASSSLHQALALGRHVVTNTAGAQEKEIAGFCHVVEHSADFITTTSTLFNKNIEQMEHEKRESFFNRNYKNEAGIKELIRMLY